MAMRRMIFLMACVLAVFLAALGACGPLVLPPPPAGLTLQPGQYVRASYFAPDFNPEEVSYTFTRFTVAPGSDALSEAFLKILQEELVRAWQAQGLKVDQGKNVVRLSGTIQGLSLKGARLRWLSGRLFASLTISGTITRGEQVLFAFQDHVDLSSPVSPGLAAPREKDLLLHQLAREAAHHILNELLLHGRTVSGERSAITRMMILGLWTTLVKSWIMPT
jgi:hypothetical protein